LGHWTRSLAAAALAPLLFCMPLLSCGICVSLLSLLGSILLCGMHLEELAAVDMLGFARLVKGWRDSSAAAPQQQRNQLRSGQAELLRAEQAIQVSHCQGRVTVLANSNSESAWHCSETVQAVTTRAPGTSWLRKPQHGQPTVVFHSVGTRGTALTGFSTLCPGVALKTCLVAC
jgi:hypothetical protein